MKRQALLFWSKKQLSTLTTNAYLETIYLLCFVLKLSHTSLITHLESSVSESEEKLFRTLVQRRCQGEPIAYLIGECEFWSISLKVTPACLIPRPETELLVEKILAIYPPHEKIQVLDLGTGSGAIAIALSLERPHWKITATDQSVEALKIAKDNAKRLGAHLEFRQGNWFEALSVQESFHIIISNPPYLSSQDPHLKNSLHYEPKTALVGGEKGTEVLHTLIKRAPFYLLAKGSLWLEQGFDQAKKVQSYFTQYGYTNIQQYYDLANINRITTGIVPSQYP